MDGVINLWDMAEEAHIAMNSLVVLNGFSPLDMERPGVCKDRTTQSIVVVTSLLLDQTKRASMFDLCKGACEPADIDVVASGLVHAAVLGTNNLLFKDITRFALA